MNNLTASLRDYQAAAINKSRSLLKTKQRLIISAPTGAGKTIIGAGIIQLALAKNKKILFIAHRHELLSQCADKLQQYGINDIAFIIAGKPAGEAPVQIASIQTLIRRELPPSDLIIIDEAHHAVSPTYKTIIAQYPSAKVIGLTATPERLDGKGLDELFEEIVEVTNIPQLIAQGFLIDPSCYIGLSPDLDKLKTCNGDYSEVALQRRANKKYLIGDIVKTWTERARNHKTIVFATGVEHSQNIVQQFKNAGISAAHLDGDTPLALRNKILSDWRSGVYQIVSNCMILTEGFDFPELSCCVLARPTKSLTLYLQMVGRIMRTISNKNSAIVLDHANCIKEHGLPNIAREWMLCGMREHREPNIYTCDKCKHAFARGITLFLSNHAGVTLACPKCRYAKCVTCGEYFSGLICANCQTEYTEDEEEEDKQRQPLLELNGKLVLAANAVIPEHIQILNTFKIHLKTAKERGFKRGFAFHKTIEAFGDDAKQYLPRHTAEWWRTLA